MAFIMISTIGFGEVHSLSIEGRIFTMGIFIFGIGMLIIAIIPNGERIRINPHSADIINEGDTRRHE